jgi:hypothetical protein
MGEFKASIPFSSFMSEEDVETLRKMNKLCEETFYDSELIQWHEVYSLLLNKLMVIGKLDKSSTKG